MITNDKKAKVFAQYLGQNCQTMTRQTQGKGLPSKYLKGELKEIDLGMQDSFIGLLLENETNWSNHENYNSDQAKLILKPLSAITDEEVIEVGKIMGYTFNKILRTPEKEFVIYGCHNYSNGKKPHPISEYIFISFFPNEAPFIYYYENSGYDSEEISAGLQVYQYLQSKGYDLPQYLLGGKTLHEAGLAIYE